MTRKGFPYARQDNPLPRVSRPGLGLYVHVPFCSIKCFYCDFFAFSGQGAAIPRYLAALERESAFYRSAGRPATLYIGGGTPTELSAEQLERLLAGVSENFAPIASLREATCEANPESAGADKLAALRRAGIGRLSLGLQATQDRLLRAIGRRHGYADFLGVFRRARALGFALSVDLMLGLPGQSEADAAESLSRVLDLAPEHLSVYCLQVEDRTLFAKRSIEPDEESTRSMYEAAIDRLARSGFRHYEISNFARGAGFRSLHNMNYWLGGPYIGLGCGASGFLGGVRYQNEERLGRYLGRVEAGERPVASSERLAGKEKLGEAILLRLRLLGGFPLTRAMRAAFRAEFKRLVTRGLVELAGRGSPRGSAFARLTREGVFLANEAFREFVPPFEAGAPT